MGKKSRKVDEMEEDVDPGAKKGRSSLKQTSKKTEGGEEELQFEDPFSDEEEIYDSNDEDADMEMVEDENGDEDEDDEDNKNLKVYIPGKEEKDQELEVDNSAYEMLHRLNVEWPMLSFDFVGDTLGQSRTKFPLSCFAVGGTESADGKSDKLVCMHMRALHRTKHDDDEDEDDSSDGGSDDLDDDPELRHIDIAHQGSVNRVRSCPQRPAAVATMSGTGKAHIWDVSTPLKTLAEHASPAPNFAAQPAHTMELHKGEGFALDWSGLDAGRLATGDIKGSIFRWQPNTEGGAGWAVDPDPYKGHTGSVEDIQWSPTEMEVFGSCSSDQTVRIWDARKKKGSALEVKASDCDVNVISWNTKVPYLLASGDDKGEFKVWDLRTFGNGQPVASFAWHTDQITSIQWNPNQPSMVAAAAADNQVTVWDLSLERDSEAEAELVAQGIPVPDIPPQLIFIHQGQKDVKEVRWHPQCPGMLGSTAADGVHLFRPINTA